MKDLLKRLIPLRLTLSAGSIRIFDLSMFQREPDLADKGDQEAEEDDEQVVVNTNTQFGFAVEPVDEIQTSLTPWEDPDGSSDASQKQRKVG